MSDTGDSDAPLTDHAVSEEQTPLQGGSIIPPTDHTPSANSTYQPIHSELPFGQQQEEQSTIVAAHSSMPPSPLTLKPPPANTQGTSAAVTVVGNSVLLMAPSELVALKQVTRYLVRLPRVPVTPTEVCRDHGTTKIVSGWGWQRELPCEDYV